MPHRVYKRASTEPSELFDEVCAMVPGLDRATFSATVRLAVEIAREGREGRKIGTMFVIGDHEAVLLRSATLILDPLKGHPPEDKRIEALDTRESLKELAQLDGAFIVANDGVVVSACRYLDASSEGIQLPLGLGTRHMAAASITRETGSVAVVVSESSVVRVFLRGHLVAEILPELWMLRDYARQLQRMRDRVVDIRPEAAAD